MFSARYGRLKSELFNVEEVATQKKTTIFNFVCANHVGEVAKHTHVFSTAVCGKAMIARFSYF